MKKKNRLQILAALLAATLSMALTSPIAAKANEEYNVGTTKETNAETGRIYYLKNSHGDVIGQMDENGNLLTSYAYNAFGEQVSTVALFGEQKSAANRFLYAGEQYDETSGLYYLRARHYDGKTGRFTQEDTYLGDGRNLYAYVHSNPLKYVDPIGHYSVEIFDGDSDSWDEKIKHEGGGGGQSGCKVDFYVTPSGEAIPSTGYRYISENAPYLDDMTNSMSIPANADGTYFSFNNYNVANPGALQVPHDASVKVSFNTLQIIDDISVPYGQWGKASYYEPLTMDFPQFGSGGATQVITYSPIIIDNVTRLIK